MFKVNNKDTRTTPLSLDWTLSVTKSENTFDYKRELFVSGYIYRITEKKLILTLQFRIITDKFISFAFNLILSKITQLTECFISEEGVKNVKLIKLFKRFIYLILLPCLFYWKCYLILWIKKTAFLTIVDPRGLNANNFVIKDAKNASADFRNAHLRQYVVFSFQLLMSLQQILIEYFPFLHHYFYLLYLIFREATPDSQFSTTVTCTNSFNKCFTSFVRSAYLWCINVFSVWYPEKNGCINLHIKLENCNLGINKTSWTAFWKLMKL